MKQAHELIEYIDHIIASLTSDYNYVYDRTRLLLENIPHAQRGRLEWDLAHMHKDYSLLINDFKRHQEDLRKGMDASTTVQDGIRGTDIQE